MLIKIQDPKASKSLRNTTRDASFEDVDCIGIDLGTTNSVVAIAKTEDKAQTLIIDQDNPLISSVVFYGADDQVIVGNETLKKFATEPQNTIQSIKRLMGKNDKEITTINDIKLLDNLNTKDNSIQLKVADKIVSPVEVSAQILSFIKEGTQKKLQREITKAVITVPAYFDDGARNDTKLAAQLSGFEVLRLINEPTAAAYAYGIDNKSEGLYLVYDLGGGTFDISLLKMQKGIFQVIASAGINTLGGDDFDNLLAKQIISERKAQGVQENIQTNNLKQLVRKSKELKEQLSRVAKVEATISINGKDSFHRITAKCFNESIAPLIDDTINTIENLLDDNDLEVEDIKDIILVGGSTKIPQVSQKIEELFNKKPLDNINPDQVVAQGAALHAYSLTKGSDNLLLDVIPLSLGIETMGGLFEKIIHRNTSIPIKKSQDFTTYQDGQTAMRISVFQGEREMTKDNRPLAEFILRDIPPMNAGNAKIRVTFRVDANGILNVTACEQYTNTVAQIEVKPSYGLDQSKMSQMLRDSLIFAQQDINERLLNEAKVEANRILLSLESALEQDKTLLSPQEIDKIDKIVLQLKNTINNSQDRNEINEMANYTNKQTEFFAQKRMNNSINQALQGKEVDELSLK